MNEYINFKINDIKQDIEILKRGQLYEIEHVPGVPKCYTLGKRIEENFDNLLKLLNIEQ